ncbi:MAG: hypothetical protein GXO42_02885 [bacterium]|nr:hypothetical protein [bacterium]
MRGIEAVVAIVLLLIMTIGLIAIVWMIFGPTMRQSSQKTGKEIVKTTGTQARATYLQTLKSNCEGNVGGHFIPTGLTKGSTITLDAAGVNVTITAINDLSNFSLCVYRAGTESDAPVVLAYYFLPQLQTSNPTLAWHTAAIQSANNQNENKVYCYCVSNISGKTTGKMICGCAYEPCSALGKDAQINFTDNKTKINIIFTNGTSVSVNNVPKDAFICAYYNGSSIWYCILKDGKWENCKRVA